MKKTYEKPRAYLERFELAEHIAGCNLELQLSDVINCGATGTIGSATIAPGVGFWFVTEPTCTVEVEDYCYTNSITNIATINS